MDDKKTKAHILTMQPPKSNPLTPMGFKRFPYGLAGRATYKKKTPDAIFIKKFIKKKEMPQCE